MANLLEVTNGVGILDEDAKAFYSNVSKVLGRVLDPSKDALALMEFDRRESRSATTMRLCKVSDGRCIALKRCTDSPEYIRREVAVAAAKVSLGFPSYSIIEVRGVQLRQVVNNQTCHLLSGWETKPTLFIDLGNYQKAENLLQLNPSSILNLGSFFSQYGGWAAFNYVVGVRDRSERNFVFFTDSQVLQSIDNEEGPLDTAGNNLGVEDIVTATRNTIRKFIPADKKEEWTKVLRQGFVEGWKRVKDGFSSLQGFHANEVEIMRRRLEANPDATAQVVFA